MASKRLLVVEDDPRSLYAFQQVLQARGFEVVAFDSAEKALQNGSHHVDSALIDVRLPKMQGPDLGLQLRKARPSINLVFITAYNGIEEIKKMIPDCKILPKPIDIDTLLKLL